MTIPSLILYSLATFRLAVLLSEDTGPARMFQKLRSWLKREAKHNPTLRKSDLHHGVECTRCSSIWFAIPVAAYAMHRDRLIDGVVIAGDVFIAAMALSGAAILWNRAFPKR